MTGTRRLAILAAALAVVGGACGATVPSAAAVPLPRDERVRPSSETPARPCARRPALPSAHGTTRWSFSRVIARRKGRYRVYVTATDAVGRHAASPTQRGRFTIR